MLLSLSALTAAATLAMAGGAVSSSADIGRLHRAADAQVEVPSDMPFRLSPRQHCDAVNPHTTASIVQALEEAAGFCVGMAGEKRAYAVDCVAERLVDVNRRMSGTEGYEDLRSMLVTTARSLNRLARRHQSETQETTRFRNRAEDGRVTATQRRLVPVADAKREAVTAAATGVIDQGARWLLDSPGCTGAQAAQFQRIAEAFRAFKTLLRGP